MAGPKRLLFITIAASLLLSQGIAAAPAQAPGMAATVTPAQGQAAVATARQANPAGVAGLSAAINSKTAICSIPTGNRGGKLINAPTLEGTRAAGAAAVAPPPTASAAGRRLLAADSWFSDIGHAFESAVTTVTQVATDAVQAVGNTAVSGAGAVVSGLTNAAEAEASGVVAAANAATNFVNQQSQTIQFAARGAQFLNGIKNVAADVAEAASQAGSAAVPAGELVGEAAEVALEGAAAAGKRRSLLTTEPLSSQSARRLLAPALAPPAPNTQSTSTTFGPGKNVAVPASVQVASIPACCQTSALPAGATAASLEQMYGLPSGSVSFINADNAFSAPGGNITLPCPRFLAWLTAAHVGISIALPSPRM